MKIKNLEIVFDKQEDNNLFFKDVEGRELIIDKSFFKEVPQVGQKLFLNIDSQEVVGAPQDILNDILDNNK